MDSVYKGIHGTYANSFQPVKSIQFCHLLISCWILGLCLESTQLSVYLTYTYICTLKKLTMLTLAINSLWSLACWSVSIPFPLKREVNTWLAWLVMWLWDWKLLKKSKNAKSTCVKSINFRACKKHVEHASYHNFSCWVAEIILML